MYLKYKDSMNVKVKNKIKEIRLALGMTQEDLAFKSGVTVTTISLVENMKVAPAYKTMICLSKALGRPLDELFYSDDIPERKRA